MSGSRLTEMGGERKEQKEAKEVAVMSRRRWDHGSQLYHSVELVFVYLVQQCAGTNDTWQGQQQDNGTGEDEKRVQAEGGGEEGRQGGAPLHLQVCHMQQKP